MKGVIAKCLGDLVTSKFGQDKWEKALEMTGLPKETTFLSSQDIDDGSVLKVIDSVCKVLGITLNQAADAFGDYWVNDFAVKVYPAYFLGVTSAKELLLKMDSVHEATTRRVPNAKPPRFEYKWENDKTLIMKYKSDRNLIDFFVSLIKGVGKHFNENLVVTKLNNEEVKVVFSK